MSRRNRIKYLINHSLWAESAILVFPIKIDRLNIHRINYYWCIHSILQNLFSNFCRRKDFFSLFLFVTKIFNYYYHYIFIKFNYSIYRGYTDKMVYRGKIIHSLIFNNISVTVLYEKRYNNNSVRCWVSLLQSCQFKCILRHEKSISRVLFSCFLWELISWYS